MEFNIAGFSDEKVDIVNTKKGISIKKLTNGIYETAERIRESIIMWNRPPYFSSKNNADLIKSFEDDIKDYEYKILRKKMLIQLMRRKKCFFAE